MPAELARPVVRTPKGLKIQPPKTPSGWRKLHLPNWLSVVLDNREHVETEWDVVYPSQQAKLRDRSITSSDLRDALHRSASIECPVTPSARRRPRCWRRAGSPSGRSPTSSTTRTSHDSQRVLRA